MNFVYQLTTVLPQREMDTGHFFPYWSDSSQYYLLHADVSCVWRPL